MTIHNPIGKLLEELRIGLDRIALFLYGSDDRPRALWHYTSADGLHGILRSSTLRFSHVRFVNDATDGVFGWSTVKQILNESFADTPELLPTLTAAYSYGDNSHDRLQYFVFCLSERSDSLSQWRAYGRGGSGYALCFSTDKLLRCVGVDPSSYDPRRPALLAASCFLAKTSYNKHEMQNALYIGAYTVLDYMKQLEAAQLSTEEKHCAVQHANELFADYLIRSAISFKDPSFSDEGEWRLVVGVRTHGALDDVGPDVQFRVDGDMIKPFVELALDAGGGEPLPITRVMIGPTLKPVISRRALELFLKYAGYDCVVDDSGVPLQA